MRLLVSALTFFILTSCGNYSFSGKSIPPNVKNAQLIIFEDNSGRYDLSLPEILNENVIRQIESYNYFDIENSADADSKIYGTVVSYSESVSSQTRDEDIDQMVISISVEINFYNNVSQEYIVKQHRVSDSEYFMASGGDEERRSAFDILIERISEKIVMALSSNW